MPLFVFSCPDCLSSYEEIFSSSAVPEKVWCAKCGHDAPRRRVNRIHVGGLSALALEHMERAVFSPKERSIAHRMRQSDDPALRDMGEKGVFRSARDVERYERAMGLRRLDPRSTEVKVKEDEQMDEARMIERAAAADGPDGACALIDKMDIQAQTGMSDAQYARWNAAQENFDVSKLPDNPERGALTGGTSGDADSGA